MEAILKKSTRRSHRSRCPSRPQSHQPKYEAENKRETDFNKSCLFISSSTAAMIQLMEEDGTGGITEKQ